MPRTLGGSGKPRRRRRRLILALGLFAAAFFLWEAANSFRGVRLLPPPAADRNGDGDGDEPDATPLPILARSASAPSSPCPPGTVPVLDDVLPRSTTHPPGRRIPRVVHVTSRGRCVDPAVRDHLDQWRLRDHSFFFHDDDAARSLLDEPWVEGAFRTGRGTDESCPGAANFTGPTARRDGCSWERSYLPDRPPRDVASKCVTSGATLSDLWRYAILYRYGGVYTDVDNSRGPRFRDDTVGDEDDLVATVEQLGIVGQYWLASSPGHPYLKRTMDDALSHLRASPNVMNNQPHRWTGPGAAKRGMCFFMEAAGIEGHDGHVSEGRHVGEDGRSVTVLGSAARSRDYVDRGGMGRTKDKLYGDSSNMTHFLEAGKSFPMRGAVSCEEHLRRTEGRPGRRANYVYDQNLQRYVEASEDKT